jgi:hypothetical protein
MLLSVWPETSNEACAQGRSAPAHILLPAIHLPTLPNKCPCMCAVDIDKSCHTNWVLATGCVQWHLAHSMIRTHDERDDLGVYGRLTYSKPKPSQCPKTDPILLTHKGRRDTFRKACIKEDEPPPPAGPWMTPLDGPLEWVYLPI